MPEQALRRTEDERFNKQLVAGSFSRAAASYDSVAGLQRQVGSHLLQLQPRDWGGQLLDLGSGTGYFSLPLAQLSGSRVVALDLAQGMLDYARSLRPHADIDYLCADAEQLPLADGCVDGLFSSLAIQWCQRPERLFAELARVLRPGARALIATLGPDTLCELRQAWAAVDGYQHVNQFESQRCMDVAIDPGFEIESFEQQRIVLQFEQLKQLTDELKGLGAHNLNPGRQPSLSGRQRVKAFRNAYEVRRDTQGKIPATYQVFYYRLKRR
ncbi:MAG: malonyl-CoA O-methyltransferase [Motiliproteus sp.]|jgi:malonyl-CoA O-methyltransferase